MRVAHAVEESLSVHLWSTSKNPLRRVLKWPDMNLKVYPRSEPPGSPRLGPNRTGRDRQSLCCKKREVNHDWAWLSLKFGDFHRFHLNSNRVYGFRRWKKYEEVGLIICLRRKSWRNYRLQPLKLMSLSLQKFGSCSSGFHVCFLHSTHGPSQIFSPVDLDDMSQELSWQ